MFHKRVKFFAWLILVDRLNMKSMLRRRHLNIHDDDLCVMCGSGEEETIEHLFFTRPFALDCWRSIHINSDMSMDLMDRFSTARQVHNMDFFPEATLIAAWELWKLRNDQIF